jgi:hypothetical protein
MKDFKDFSVSFLPLLEKNRPFSGHQFFPAKKYFWGLF